jgi:hypothetical protein
VLVVYDLYPQPLLLHQFDNSDMYPLAFKYHENHFQQTGVGYYLYQYRSGSLEPPMAFGVIVLSRYPK